MHQRRRMGHAGAANEKSGETELAKQILLDSPYVNTKEQLRLFREAGGKNRKILRVATISVGLWVVPTEGKNWRNGAFDADTPRESVLFIGTQFSILYTFMYSPA